MARPNSLDTEAYQKDEIITHRVPWDYPRRIALFTVSSAHLHYNKIWHVCEAISGYFAVLARNCLASTLNYIVMQMRKTNREKLTVKRAIGWGCAAPFPKIFDIPHSIYDLTKIRYAIYDLTLK